MTDWLGVAHDVAGELASDAVERDRQAKPPTAEVELVRGAGLLPLLVPAAWGGAGQPWSVAHRVVRIVGAADASIGQLLGYHYLHLWRAGLVSDPATHEHLETGTARHRWFWAGAPEPGVGELTLTPTETGFVVDGRASSATGASVADRLVVQATRTDTGVGTTFTIGWRAPGLRFADGWDSLGQRLTAGGSVEFTAVPVDAGDVLGIDPPAGSPAAVRRSLAPLGFQVVLAQLCVAVAEGALRAAGDYTRAQGPAAAPGGGDGDGPAGDPDVVAGYGRLVSQVAAAGALADRAAEVLDAAAGAGLGLTAGRRGQAAALAAQAHLVAAEAAADVTSRAFELTGPGSTATRHGLDRFWRNARTLSLQGPLARQARTVGRHFLAATPGRPAAGNGDDSGSGSAAKAGH